jgi:hypothetical protein
VIVTRQSPFPRTRGAHAGLAALVPARGAAGIAALVLLQQAAVMARAGARVALFGGEVALVERLAPTPSQTAAGEPAPAPLEAGA